MSINVFLLFFSFVFRLSSTWERVREDIYNWVKGGTVSKFTYLISMDSCREYFFFYGLTDFILFLVLAWKHCSFVSEIFFRLLLPGVLGFSYVRHEPCPTTNFRFSFFRWREEGATSVLGSQPIIWLLPSSFRQATQVRSQSTNICWSPLWPTFFTLTACYC